MLKLVEFGLLAVSLLIIFGLVAASPHSSQPAVSELGEGSETEIGPVQKL